MGWKTAPNTNLYLLKGNEDGTVPANPELQALRWVSSSLEGSYETIANDTKLPGRNPSKDFKGTDTNAGDLVANFAGLEHDDMFAAVLCSEDGFVKNTTLSVDGHDVFDMVPGNKQRFFALLKEYTQDPKLWQLFRGLQFNTLSISFTISALVKLTFGLMGANNAELEDAPPVDMANKLPAHTTEEFITLQGACKVKGPDDAEPVEYIDFVDIKLDITNNMQDLKGLFQKEAIDKSLGMLDITGTINEYVKDGKLYNLAKRGEDGELYITVFSDKDDIKYEFILKISFDNSTLSGDPQLQYALPFKTFGEGRFILRKTVKAEPVPGTVPVTGVSLNVDELELQVNDTEQLIATVAPSDATNKNVTWESSDTDIVTVDQSGNVLAIAVGVATITVTTEDGGFEAECEVTVEA
jgi:hypothetical protein